MSRRLDSFRLLGNRRFAALWASDLISTLGDRVHRVALATLVYQLTGSLTETGIAFVATALPDLLLGLVAGVYVDRWDRRRTLVLCDLLRVPLVVAIPFVANVSLALVYLILFVLNSLSVVFRPAKTATIPAVVEAADLNAANALSSVSENVSDIVGYPLAGALLGAIAAIAGERAGLTLAFGFDALTYLLSALLILTVRLPRSEAEPGQGVASVWQDLREGVAFVRRCPALRANTLVMLLGPLALGATTPLMVGYANDVLHGGSWAFAMLGTGISVGSIVGGLWLSTVRDLRPGPLVVAGLSAMGLSVMSMALVEALWPAVLIIAVSGIGSMMVLIPSVTLVQRYTPEHLLGRVFSLRSTLIFGAIIASNALGGWSGEAFGVQRALFACGALLAVCAAAAAGFPSVRRVDLSLPLAEEPSPLE